MRFPGRSKKAAPDSKPEPSGETAADILPTEEFAREYARNAVPAMLKAIGVVKQFNRFTLIGALLTSYLHQAHYLWSQDAGYFAYVVPLIFDTAMVSMLTVVRTPGIARDAKRGAMFVFAVAALLSAVVNFAAPGSLGLRLIFALVVVLVIGVELVAGRIRPDFAAIEAQAAELLQAVNDLKAKHTVAADLPAEKPATLTVTEPAHHAPPAHLIPVARFSVVQHEQATGQPITADELAARLSITPAVAGQLLTSINPARINGAPVLDGTR